VFWQSGGGGGGGGASIGLLLSREQGRRTLSFVRLALKLVMQDDGDLVDVILL